MIYLNETKREIKNFVNSVSSVNGILVLCMKCKRCIWRDHAEWFISMFCWKCVICEGNLFLGIEDWYFILYRLPANYRIMLLYFIAENVLALWQYENLTVNLWQSTCKLCSFFWQFICYYFNVEVTYPIVDIIQGSVCKLVISHTTMTIFWILAFILYNFSVLITFSSPAKIYTCSYQV